MKNGFRTFSFEDREYKSPSTKKVKKLLSEIGINTEYNCLIRKQVHIIVNDGDKLDLQSKQTDSQFQKAIKEKILKGEKSFILKI